MGFQFAELSNGRYTRVGAPDDDRRMGLDLVACAPSLATLVRGGSAELRGVLEMEGFADVASVAGELRRTGRELVYRLELVANDRQDYRFEGRKRIDLSSLASSWGTIRGVVFDRHGRRVATCSTRAERADLPALLASIRPA